MATDTIIHTPLQQRASTLTFAAEGTPINAAATQKAQAAPTGPSLILAASDAKALAQQVARTPPATTCQQCLTLNFFFDGTGNNLDADVGTQQQSNVAKLFQSRIADDPATGLYSFYIPGIGTYFKEIGDPGNTTRGKGLGHMGQPRLDWAFKQFDDKLRTAELRAQNPTNKITYIRVSVFGFSRGATLARAFVRDLNQRCIPSGTGFVLKAGRYPVEVLFLGVFDTVASVGMPMSANNTPGATSAGWYSTSTTLNVRSQGVGNGIVPMAFGEPGADPAPGNYDGHASWADGLEVPALVKECLHMVAGHEVRNSFPVDSVLAGRRYPAGTTEMVYPGAHSDVGGGYQPGEGARSPHPGEMLSLIPLRAMYQRARAAGVSLYSMDTLQKDHPLVAKAFAFDAEGSSKFAEMNGLFQHYMRQSGSGGRDVGQELLAHAAWYLRWRFFNMRRTQRNGGVNPDAATARQREQAFARERARMDKTLAPLKAQVDQAQAHLNRANQAQQQAQYRRARAGVPVPQSVHQDVAMAQQEKAQADDAYLRAKAQSDTYANDSTLPANLAAYDARLLQDAQAIARHHQAVPGAQLRPHYRNLLAAYEAHYLRQEPLDDKVVAFFDRYVHDSLSGFATDATLPSDPRVIYVGGDNKLRYASLERQEAKEQSQAA